MQPNSFTNWEAKQPSTIIFTDGTKYPEGTIWSFDTESRLTGHIIAKCEIYKFNTNLSYYQYVEMFGEDQHIWRVEHILHSSVVTDNSDLNTSTGQLWTFIDLGDRILANCSLAVSPDDKKADKQLSSYCYSFTLEDYIKFFGEDKHMNWTFIHQRRFDL